MFPKATDKTFEDKLKANHLGKSPNFVKPSTKTDKNAHFAIVHYADNVSYNVTGWLEKNKDPLNDTVVELMKTGSNKLVVHIWADHPGQGVDADDMSKGGKKGRKAKGSSCKTVSSFYTQQLNALMTTLHATEPHFIRCIIPNNHKQPGRTGDKYFRFITTFHKFFYIYYLYYKMYSSYLLQSRGHRVCPGAAPAHL